MKILLDTHIFLWWDNDPAQLSSAALALCQDPDNSLLLSVASVGNANQTTVGKVDAAFAAVRFDY